MCVLISVHSRYDPVRGLECAEGQVVGPARSVRLVSPFLVATPPNARELEGIALDLGSRHVMSALRVSSLPAQPHDVSLLE